MDWPMIIAAFVGAVAGGYLGGKAGAKEDAKPSDTSSGKDQQSPPSGG